MFAKKLALLIVTQVAKLISVSYCEEINLPTPANKNVLQNV